MEHTTTLLPHVILIPSPGMGHFIPVAEFAKRLVLDHGFSATLIIPTDTNSPFKSLKLALNTLPSAINPVLLPPVDVSDLPSGTDIVTQIVSIVNRSLPAVSDSVRTITSTHRVVSFIVDYFCTDAVGIANEFNIDAYVFSASTAMFLSLIYHAPKLDQVYSCEFRDVPEPIQIPGCVPIRGVDLFRPFEDRKSESYARFLQFWKRLNLGKGIFINSFDDIEHNAIEALNEKRWSNPPVYAVGPLTRTGVHDDKSDGSGCLKWLDDQPAGSVLFVSFGSGGTLSGEQLTELAFGLEMSEQKFLWFLRNPTPTESVRASYLNARNVDDPSKLLPNGFLDRTRKSGVVVSSWAPQIEILSHVSTGGFLSHCGWNSTLESIVHGVPLIAWPLFAEQKMNAVMLTDDMKVALRPKPMKNDLIIGRDEICKVVKELMEGEEGRKLRNKMRRFKCVATSTLAEGGSSFRTFSEAVNAWKSD